MKLELLEIAADGTVEPPIVATETTQSVCDAMTALYGKHGFHRPWIGYLASEQGQVVGMCGFKSPPLGGRVEIAYGTISGNEGRGVATEMARQLISRARAAEAEIIIFAQTLPQQNASTTILTKLGFARLGTVDHEEDGEVWEWELPAAKH